MVSFSVGSLMVYTYGLCVALALGGGFFWLHMRSRGMLKRGTVSFFALMALPLSFFAARLGICLVSQGLYLFQQDFFFHFSRGGYLLYGALAGWVLAAWLTTRLTRQSFSLLVDLFAAPWMLIVAVLRLAEGLVGCGYGRSIYDWFDPMLEQTFITWEDPSPLFRFPFGIQNYYGEWCWSIFLLEGFFAILFLILLVRKGIPSPHPIPEESASENHPVPAGRFFLMLLLYAGAQTLLESLRADAIPRWGFVRVNQLLSGILVVLVLFVSTLRVLKAGQHFPWVAWAGTFLSLGLILVMEFAVEQKISFLQWMKMDLCYLVLGAGSLGLILSGYSVWKSAWKPGAERVPPVSSDQALCGSNSRY